MPPLLDLLRRLVGDRRREPRYSPPADAPVPAVILAPAGDGEAHRLTGRVRDIGTSGLAVTLPSPEDCARFGGEGLRLTVVVALPYRALRLRASDARCEPAGGGGYLVGMTIAEMGEEDRAALDRYLRSSRVRRA